MDPCGGTEHHPDKRDPSKRCAGAVLFDLPGLEGVFPEAVRWKLVSIDPLHLEPSLLCTPEKGGCGNHGFIRGGRWVDA